MKNKKKIIFVSQAFEGYSLSILEAKILGTPILATYSAAENQIENGVDGFLCKTNEESIYENISTDIMH